MMAPIQEVAATKKWRTSYYLHQAGGFIRPNLLEIRPAIDNDVRNYLQGIPDVTPVEMCYLGWQESLMQLALLVEPEIPQE